MKRQRGRGRKPSNPGNRSHESNGPDVKIRGSASQIYEKYMQYARDAQTMGDRVKAENLFQHAEHYYRIMAASMPKERPPQNDDQQQNANEEAGSDANDSLKVLDEEDGGADVVDASSDDADTRESAASTASSDAEADAAPKRRRRTRRKPVGSEDEGNGDAEAKSALDALAREQAAIADN